MIDRYLALLIMLVVHHTSYITSTLHNSHNLNIGDDIVENQKPKAAQLTQHAPPETERKFRKFCFYSESQLPKLLLGYFELVLVDDRVKFHPLRTDFRKYVIRYDVALDVFCQLAHAIVFA